jgi:hypothetical protein
MSRTIKVGDQVYFGLGWGIVTDRSKPTGFKYKYTIRLEQLNDREVGKQGKEYETYYCIKASKSSKNK